MNTPHPRHSFEPGPEPTTDHLREYLDIIGPFAASMASLKDKESGPFSSESKAGGTPGSNILSAYSGRERTQPKHVGAYDALHEHYLTEKWPRLVRSGNYDRLRSFADEAASAAVNAYDDGLTIPRAFGVHALSCGMATVFRPHTSEVPHANDRTTFFLVNLARKLALKMPEEALFDGPNPVLLARAVGKRSLLLAKGMDETPAWFNAKFRTLFESIQLRKSALNAIAAEQTAQTDDHAELRRYNDDLFKELRRLRRYTIKSALHEGTHSAWSIDDLTDLRSQQAVAAEKEQSGIHPDRWAPMVMVAVEQPLGLQGIAKVMAAPGDIGVEADALPYRTVFMDDRGKLFADPDAAMPLKDIYEAAGKPVNYEALRQFLIQRYFDLTVPVEVVRRAQEGSRLVVGSRNPDTDREQGIVYHDLLLPRIRIIRAFSADSLDALEAQERRQKQEGPSTPYPYERVGHPRKLPPGFRASERARRLAAEDNVSLAPDETYVRPYRPDPSIAKTSVHRARYKKDPGGRQSTGTPPTDIPPTDAQSTDTSPDES